MRRPAPTAPIILVSLVIILLLIVGIITAVHRQEPKTSNTSNHTSAKVAKNDSTPKSPSNSASKNTAATNNLSPADQAVEANAAHAVTDACKLFTLNAALQVLGGSAKSSAASGTSPLNAPGTTVTACAYTSSSGSAQLIIRTPTDHLGVSENASVFGSARPADAISVNGYGQSAYWDPNKHTLNILGDNNWYIISRTTNTQAAAVSVAKLLQTGF